MVGAEPDNLAYACVFCNRAKGSDIGSGVQGTGAYVRFFHPRVDRWVEHFTLDGVIIAALSDIREVTSRILAFNTSERLLERQVLRGRGPVSQRRGTCADNQFRLIWVPAWPHVRAQPFDPLPQPVPDLTGKARRHLVLQTWARNPDGALREKFERRTPGTGVSYSGLRSYVWFSPDR